MRGLEHVNSVTYFVTARWLFYRLLQEGLLQQKGDYRRLLGYLSKARKGWWNGWTPFTLTDDTRAPLLTERYGMYEFHVRGPSFKTGQEWLDRLVQELNCPLDLWPGQHTYVEVYFEAAAMQGQFRQYAHEALPLLSFHGDVSIAEKWRSADRLVDRWVDLDHPSTKVLYYGDLDEKGVQIPESARRDIETMMVQSLWRRLYRERGWTASQGNDEWAAEWRPMVDSFEWIRVGLTDQQVIDYDIPENPERPGSYQWEAVPDAAAEELIGLANQYLDQDAFDEVAKRAEWLTTQVRQHLSIMELEEDEEGVD